MQSSASRVCCALVLSMSLGAMNSLVPSTAGSHERAAAATASTTAPDLDGEWLATLTTRNVDDFRIYLTLRRTGGGGATAQYEAYSRPGALRAMMSWRQYMLGRIARKLPRHLAALRLDSLRVEEAGDSARVRAAFISPMLGTLRLFGSVRGDSMRGVLRSDSTGPELGRIVAVRAASHAVVRDYGALARAIPDTIAAYIFNPRLMQTPGWRGFFTELSHRLGDARDDLDAMLAFYALLPRLGMSHFNLTHHPGYAAMSVDSALTIVSAPPESLVTLTFLAPGVARLYVSRWERVSAVVDRAFARIDSAKVHTLLLDIRGNRGGDQSSWSPVAHVASETTYAGALLGNGWYREHETAPPAEQLPSLPTSSKDDLLTTFRMLRERGAVAFRMPPREPRFTGKIFLLVNGISGSASEPLAHYLKTSGHATLVGERTPGAILAAVPHPVGQGWVLTLPEADYYAADGVRLEGNGVSPHVSVPGIDAVIAVADSLRPRDPYAAALVAATGALMNVTNENRATRLRLAERWSREALRLGPDSASPVNLLAAALANQRNWAVGFALWDSLLAVSRERPVVWYQIGRFAALSGERLDDGERSLQQYLGIPRPRYGPSHALAHWYLGTILEKRGDQSAARREYESGLTLEPNNPDLKRSLVRLGSPRAP